MHTIDRIEQRTFRYWYEDGLAELAGGLVFLLLGLFFLLQAVAAPGPVQALSAVLVPLLVIGAGLASRSAVKALKARVTYPRTGYVAYRHTPRNRRLVVAAVAFVFAGLFSLLAQRVDQIITWIPVIQGLLIGAWLVFLAVRFSLTRFYAVALVSIAAGILPAYAGLSTDAAMAILFGAAGAALIVSGALALRGYLAATEPPREEAA